MSQVLLAFSAPNQQQLLYVLTHPQFQEELSQSPPLGRPVAVLGLMRASRERVDRVGLAVRAYLEY